MDIPKGWEPDPRLKFRHDRTQFTVALKSPRLRAAFTNVWKQIPPRDANLIDQSLRLVTDDEMVESLFIFDDEKFDRPVVVWDYAPSWNFGFWLIYLDGAASQKSTTEELRFFIACALATVLYGRGEEYRPPEDEGEAEDENEDEAEDEGEAEDDAGISSENAEERRAETQALFWGFRRPRQNEQGQAA